MLSIDEHEFIWCEKFRPRVVENCILPDHLKKIAKGVMKDKNFQNLTFHSGPGTGKTTLARAMCEELGLDYILINGSKEGRLLDTVRNVVTHFASTLSVLDYGEDKFKVVIYDEFDNAPGDVQKAVRGLIDEVSDSCRFIFTGNYISKIIEPITSRAVSIDFSIPKDEQPKIMSQMMARCCEVLDHEKIPYSKLVIAKFVGKYFPDFRRIINELQLYSNTGIIDEGILARSSSNLEDLADFVLNKDFRGCESWVLNNYYDGGVFSKMIELFRARFQPSNWSAAYLESNRYQLQHVTAIDPDMNLKAYCIEMMGFC